MDTDSVQVDTIRAGLVSTSSGQSNSLNVDSVVVDDAYISPGGVSPVQYGLLVAVSGSGTTNATGIHNYDSGSLVAVTASADYGWAFSNWLLNGTNVGSANPYVVTMTENRNLTAVFTPR